MTTASEIVSELRKAVGEVLSPVAERLKALEESNNQQSVKLAEIATTLHATAGAVEAIDVRSTTSDRALVGHDARLTSLESWRQAVEAELREYRGGRHSVALEAVKGRWGIVTAIIAAIGAAASAIISWLTHLRDGTP
ncbi:hypothetical protein [Gloeobacter kilaueensis]|uniref:hypothetical protein n=1 Tax=Gloeobacter kilaueensis TaxID=1416614 RepID=UPI00059ED77E|nr:hypothetical protein [Gloeobacter kilaueensis]